MLSFSDAHARILSSIERTLPMETVPIVLSLDRVLASSIIAQESIPAAANSAMDGFALRAEDVTAATLESPAMLRVIGESAAGSLFNGTVGVGEAVRIMTGGVLPDGANAIVEVESTYEADGIVEVRRAVSIGTSVRAVGEDVHVGEEVITKGKRITPGDIGVLASLGVANVPVSVRPNVAILSTGNEVIDLTRRPSLGQVRNSSAPALYASCQRAGAEPIDLGIASDDRDELLEKLEMGLRFDILLTTGGVSAGAYDYVQHLLPELGVEVVFHKTNIRPGRPMLFGTFGAGNEQTLVFALPGNPVSSLVTFDRYVVPAINRLLGAAEEPLQLRARLDETITTGDGKRHFMRGILSTDSDGALRVIRTGTQSSGVMSSMSRANCLIVIPEDRGRVEQGEMVEVRVI